ncbi:hypothetical protein [Archaeoglobus sp.]
MLLMALLISAGFLCFLGLGWSTLAGYRLIKALCEGVVRKEDTKTIEDEIATRSRMLKAYEKLTSLVVASVFLSELERQRFAIDVGYTVTFLVTLVLLALPVVNVLVWSAFFGATLFMFVLWALRFSAVKAFARAFEG